MEYVENFYIKILSPVANRSNEGNRRLRHILAGVLFFLIIFFSYLAQMSRIFFDGSTVPDMSLFTGLHHAGYRTTAIISSLLLLGIVLLMAEKPMKKIKWNFYAVSLWFLMCILIIMAGISHSIGEGYVITQIALMILIPALAVTVGNDRDRLAEFFDMTAIVMMIFLLVVTLLQMIFLPFVMEYATQGYIVSNRYMGMTMNPNRVGEYASLGLVASLYVIYRKKGALRIVGALTAGACIAQSLMCISRTSMLSCALVLTTWLIFMVRDKVKIKELIIVLIIIVASVIGTYEATTRASDPLKLRSQITQNMIVAAAEEKETPQTAGNVAGDRTDDSSVSNRLKSRENMDEFSSGRIAIWKMCLDKITWSGSDITYAYPLRVLNTNGNGYSYIDLMHNTALEYAMRCGWVVGIILVGMELWALIFVLSILFGKRKRIFDGRVFAALGILAFLVAGNVEPINEPFWRITFLVFYFSIIPLFSFAANYSIRKSKLAGLIGNLRSKKTSTQ